MLFVDLSSSAQQFAQLNYEFYGKQNGLSNHIVRCFAQDANGFVWIGTDNGLNRFDGTNIKVYQQNHRKKNSLPNRIIKSIQVADSSRLWIYTHDYLVLYNPETDEAIDYTTGKLNGLDFKLNGSMGELFYDKQKQLYLINDHGISYFDKEQNSFILTQIWRYDNPSSPSLVNAYYELNDSTLLLNVHNAVVFYNTRRRTYNYIPDVITELERLEPYVPLTSIFMNDDGKIWLGTWGAGLFIFDIQKHKNKQFLLEENITNRGLQNIIFHIKKQDSGIFKDQILLVTGGIQNQGVFQFKPKQHQEFPGFDRLDCSATIKDNLINDCLIGMAIPFVGREDVTFLGGNNGFVTVHPRQHLVKIHKEKRDLNVCSITSRYDKFGKIKYYTGSVYDGGLHIFDESLNLTDSYDHIPPSSTFHYNADVNCVYKDKQNRIWVCTWNGLHLLDEEKKTFKSYYAKPENPDSLCDNMINRITQDHSGIFWISFYKAGVQCFDAEKEKFYRVPSLKIIETSMVGEIAEDTKNNLWIRANYYILKLSKNRDLISKYEPKKYLSNQNSTCLHLDSKDRLWIGSDNGLNLYKPETDNFQFFFTNDGLLDNHIENISEDNLGRIWISHVLSLSIYDSQLNGFSTFDGIENKSFHLSPNGVMLLGGYGNKTTISAADPSAFVADTTKAIPFILGVSVSGVDFQNQYYSTQVYDYLEFPHTNNFLSFEFSGINFNHAEKNKFRCKLDGLENNWNELGTKRNVTYAGLSPGEYTFLLQACNSDGIWNPKIAAYKVVIHPPFWQKWWFISLIVLALGIIVFFIYKRQLQKLRFEESVKTKLAQLETQALMAQMNPHFIFNSLNSIQACIVSGNNDAAHNYLNKFSKLVRSILQNSREQFILLSEELNVITNYLELEKLRFKDFRFDIEIESDVNTNSIKVPSSFMQPFAENSIVHGLANSENEKFLHVKIYKENTDLVFVLTDNGIGRKKSAELNLKRPKSHTSIGTALVQSRLDLINSQYSTNANFNIIDLTNDEGHSLGTMVVIRLPLEIQDEIF